MKSENKLFVNGVRLHSDDADLRGAADEIIYDWQRIEAARN